MIARIVLFACLASGCATVSTASGIGGAADTFDGATKAVKAVDAGLPASFRTPEYKTARDYVVAGLVAAVPLLPPCTATSIGAALLSIATNVDVGLVAFFATLRPPAPHTAALAPLPKNPHAAALQVVVEWVNRQPTTHAAALSGTDIAGIITAVIGGAAALGGAGAGIANAVKNSGTGNDVTACQASETAFAADVVTLKAALEADDKAAVR